jgi:hypothetical protein
MDSGESLINEDTNRKKTKTHETYLTPQRCDISLVASFSHLFVGKLVLDLAED